MRVVAAVLAGLCCDANALSSACLVEVMGEGMCLRKNVSDIFFAFLFPDGLGKGGDNVWWEERRRGEGSG